MCVDMPAPCRHCGRGDLVWRRRGLCWRCHRSRRVRRHYAMSAPGGPALLTGADLPDPLRPAPGPLPGQPGSLERVSEMQRRYELRAALWPDRSPVTLPLGRVAELFGVGMG